MFQSYFKRKESKDQAPVSKKWKTAWLDIKYRIIIISGVISFLIIVLFIYPPFFRYIEKRQGYLLSDWFLNNIPAINVSLPVFICIWGMFFLLIIRAIKSPVLFRNFLISYILLSITRIGMIFLLPLEPPPGIIELKDPLLSLFIGQKFISKDLFFSGHTSMIFLLFLCVENKTDKRIAAGTALITGVLLIMQHVHYTIDVAAAPLFAYICFRLAKKFGLIT